MGDRYYLLSKDVGDGPYLIGELCREGADDYSFRYMIDRPEFPQWFMEIPGMSGIRRTYGTDEVLQCVLHRVVPNAGTRLAQIYKEDLGLESDHPWEMLEALIKRWEGVRTTKYPLSDSHDKFFFYEEIPGGANVYA